MFKGLKVLFTSGLIIDPMVLTGIVLGYLMCSFFEIKDLMVFFSMLNYYVFTFGLAFVYVILFKKVYKAKGMMVDWKATGAKIFSSFLKLLFSNVLSIIFFDVILAAG